ncbi:Ig-like domain-containing protein [Cohnella endophytica]|uniref:Ig-like domain-containing protein n=1 Tax=Cohnella endophytica TaxID=2419778 RepID=UPI001314883D|nr:Ig-like domain-containing protein [Cohnella endophytica]
MQLKRTLSFVMILSLLLQLWVAGVATAAQGDPAVVSTYPSNNETSVPANAKLRIKFDQNVLRGGGTIAIKNSATNATAVSYDINNGNIIFLSADTVQIDPGSSLVAGQRYYVEISNNAFVNSSGGGYAGIANATTWNFGVIANDFTPPTATLTPVSGGTMTATGALKLLFSEIVNTASGSIRIIRTDTGDTQIISVLSPEVTGSGIDAGGGKTEITIRPSIRLVSGKSYQVQIDPTAFVDVVGNAFAPPFWSFTTTAPLVSVSSLAPADDSVGVPIGAFTATMTFGSTIYKGTSGKIYLKRVDNNAIISTLDMATSDASRVTTSGLSATINFATSLLPNTSYYIMMDPGVFKDAANNLYEGIVDAVSWNFSTIPGTDTTPPVAISVTPSSGSTTSAISGSLSIKFNEPVKPGSGTIVIRNATTTSIFCSIPVTSGAVTGGGTDTITITPSAYGTCGNFVKNTSYAVQIGSLAITDLSGNAYAGIATTDYSSWWFRISSDTTPPELVSTSPVSGTNSVKTNATLSMLFDEPILVNAGVTATIYPVIGAVRGTGIPATLSADSANSRKVNLTTPGLTMATSYIVNVPNNAITDVAANPFPGILNDYRWTFQTIGTDTTAPVFVSAMMDGSALVLTYNKDLDEDFVPYPSNFFVTVNDVPRQVNAISIVGRTVRLTMQSGVAVGQAVKVSYTRDSDSNHILKDLSGNPAAPFTAKEVTNTLDTTLARPVSGMLNGTVLTLTFNKSLAALTSGAVSQFVVKYNGVAQGVSNISASGTTVTLTIPYASVNVQSVSVSYAPGAAPLRDLSGNAVTGFADFYVQNANDITPPVLASATAVGTKITLTFNEGLDMNSVPLKSNFSVIKGSTAAAISSVVVTNNAVELTMTQAIETDAVLYVSYIPGGTGIKDLAGNAAVAINSYRIVASSSITAVLSSAVVKAGVITLTYSAPLNATSVPYSSQYYVKVDGTFSSISSIAVSGATVNLTLATPVKTGQTVSLSYMPTGVPLKDQLNQPVAAIAETAVTNQSSTIVNLPDYLEADSTGGLQFVVAKTSSTGSGALPSGRSTVRYTLDGTKFLGAYDTIRQSGGVSVPRVTFKVPSTELGALVAIPISAIMDAASRASNASFRVDFGDLQFELPLTAVNYSKEIYLAGGNTNSSYLQLSIEKNASAPVVSALNIIGAQSLATPADFSAGILTGTNVKAIDNYDSFVKRTFVLSSLSGSTSNVSVVRLDSASNELVYVPTVIEGSGGTTRVNFMRKGNSTYAVVRKNATFTDMDKHWASNEVLLLASKFIVPGYTVKTFAPGRSITRSEFAEFIARGIGLDGDRTAASRYSDVSVQNLKAAYIGAVSKAGIVEGGSDGKFRPNAAVTREEMATMLVRAMNYVGVQTSTSSSALNAFKDKNKVSNWAKDGMSICVTAGFIKGSTANTINPQSNATRAEAAIMIKRFLEYVNFL